MLRNIYAFSAYKLMMKKCFLKCSRSNLWCKSLTVFNSEYYVILSKKKKWNFRQNILKVCSSIKSTSTIYDEIIINFYLLNDCSANARCLLFSDSTVANCTKHYTRENTVYYTCATLYMTFSTIHRFDINHYL